MQAIQFITYKKLDKNKWDACIASADNSLIYAYSWYLDIMADNWDALVFGNYEAVMPLTWRKKYTIKYLYQPAFTAMLGVFGKQITKDILLTFFEAIPAEFRYIDIYLNPADNADIKGFYQRVNYELSLGNDYLQINSAYRENLKRNIAKSEKAGCRGVKDVPLKNVIALAKEFRKKSDRTSDEDYSKFSRLFSFLKKRNQAVSYGIYSSNNQLLASAVFITDEVRAYYILVGNHPDGKTIGASHALIDAFIKDNAGKKMILDFEGSDVASLAFFYSSFGAYAVQYPSLKINRLPSAVRWLKQ